MCRERFPGDWPTLEIMRQFITNHRKHEKKKSKKRTCDTEDPDVDGLGPDTDMLPNVEDDQMEVVE